MHTAPKAMLPHSPFDVSIVNSPYYPKQKIEGGTEWIFVVNEQNLPVLKRN